MCAELARSARVFLLFAVGAVRDSGDWELLKDVRGYEEHLLHPQPNRSRWPAAARHNANVGGSNHNAADSLSEPLLSLNEEYHSPPSSVAAPAGASSFLDQQTADVTDMA